MAIDTTKAVAFVVLRPPPDRASVAKAASFVVLRPPPGHVSVTKSVAFAVLKPSVAPAAGAVIQPIIIGY